MVYRYILKFICLFFTRCYHNCNSHLLYFAFRAYFKFSVTRSFNRTPDLEIGAAKPQSSWDTNFTLWPLHTGPAFRRLCCAEKSQTHDTHGKPTKSWDSWVCMSWVSQSCMSTLGTSFPWQIFPNSAGQFAKFRGSPRQIYHIYK